MKSTLLALSLIGVMLVGAAGCASMSSHRLTADEMSDEALDKRARALLREAPLIDGHNDTPWSYRRRVNNDLDALDFASDLTTIERPPHTDIGRLRAGGVGGQFWSVFIPITVRGGQAGDARTVIEQIDFVKRLCERYPETLEMAYTAADVERIHAAGRIASLCGMEGGHSIENSLPVLRALYDIGARYMTVTHGKNLDWADSATDDAQHDGLTEFGEAVIREMNRLGMLVDLSHVSAATMHDVLDVAEAPVIFSHSSAFSLCRHVRNVPDDVLVRVKENDGVVMITFLGYYVSEELRTYGERVDAERDRLRGAHGDDEDAVRAGVQAWRDAHSQPKATLEQVADHIDYVRDTIGVDHIGVGGDYDGTSSLPVGLEDVSTYPALIVELLRRGYSDEDVKKIAGLNVLRALRGAEATAARLQRTTAPGTATLAPPGGG